MISDNLSAINAFSEGVGISAHNVANINTPDFQSEQFAYGSGPTGNVTVQRREPLRPANESFEDAINQTPANIGQDSDTPQGQSESQLSGIMNNDVDLPREFVSQISAQNSFEANVIAITTRTDMEQDLYSQVHGPSIISYSV